MSKSRFGFFGKSTRRSNKSNSRSCHPRLGTFELLESRQLLSTTVASGAPVIVSFDDPTATADTVYTVKSSNTEVTATLLNTTVLTMNVHTVNSDGSTGVSGTMVFLLLSDYAPNNISHITTLVNDGLYDGLTFHRILESFMIQGGDPLGTGSGGSGDDGASGDVQDDEFDVDLRFTSSGLLAMANSGNDTNDCQFFITADTYRSGDYQYTIIGKLVAGDDIRQAIAAVPVQDNGNGETSEPVNAPIIDSITIGTSYEYGLIMLKATSGATVDATTNISVATNDNSVATLTDSDGVADQSVLAVTVTTDTPSTSDRPAFVEQTMPDVYTTVNTAVTFAIETGQGDAGVALAYGAAVGSDTTSLTCESASDGTAYATATPSDDIMGVYDLLVGVWRDSTDTSTNTDYDSQHVALFVRPTAPTTLTLTTSGLSDGSTTSINNNLTFQVSGVTAGLTVGIFCDDNPDPIGTGVLTGSGSVLTITTTVAVSDGAHTFHAKQGVAYQDTVVGNRTIAAGTLYSENSTGSVSLTITTVPTAVANLSDVDQTDTAVTFVVIYSNPGDTITVATIDSNDVTVTNASGVAQTVTFVDTVVSDDGATVKATYRIEAPGGAWDSSNLVTYTVTMVAKQVSDAAGNYVAAGTLLSFNPSDLVAPTVTIDQASTQADPTSSSTINFTVVFSEKVTDFATGDVTIGGTAGATTATVTASGTDGTTYTVAVTGMTQDGTVILTLAAGVATDAVGNPNTASTSTDNSVTYGGAPVTVTINQASTTADPTASSTIHFTVVFSKSVSDFAAADVTLVSTTLGVVKATVTGSGTTYDVAVQGMASSGKVTVSIPAGVAHDSSLSVANTASTSTDNSVQFALAAKPTFRLTAPNGLTVNAGQSVTIAWYATNIIEYNNTVSLNYDIDKTPNRNEHWIEVDKITSTNGYNTYSWDTTGVAAGTYYIAGYMYCAGAIRSYCTVAITIVAPKAVFRLTSPTSGTYTVGDSVVVTWAASSFTSGSTVSLCYDNDKVINHTEHYFEVDKVTANNLSTGYGTYTWDTTGMKPGTYYIAGYIWSNGKPTFSHLTQAITIVAAPTATFRITAPTSGTYTVGQEVTIYWTANNYASGATISLCYDNDKIINHTEHYIEVDKVTASNAGGYSSYTWTIGNVTPGTYYIGGYIWSNGKPTFSHLSTPITIVAAAALTVDASTPASNDVSSLTDAMLQPIIIEAERRLTAATGIDVAAAMSGVSVNVADLSGSMLGEAAGNSIYISRNAAGYGWFVDSTPADDSEFTDSLGSYALAASSESPAANRVDLLTTVMHEMSHLLGYDHSDSLDLMNATLLLGERRLLDGSFLPFAESHAVDNVFASVGNAKEWI
jgi:cyclophilin family peptidyl-prolyl cis-trans isomerase